MAEPVVKPVKAGNVSFSIVNNNPDKEVKLAIVAKDAEGKTSGSEVTVSGLEKHDFELEPGKHLDVRVR